MTISSASNYNPIISNSDILEIVGSIENGLNIISASLGGSERYSVYKAVAHQNNHKTTADTVMPYIADAVAMAFASS